MANCWSAAKANSLPKSSCAACEKDRCIANIVPGWKLGEVIEGDVVSPAHPAILEMKRRAVNWLWLLALGAILPASAVAHQ